MKNAVDTFMQRICSFNIEAVFNPWSMNCEHTDREESFAIRRQNLRSVLCSCVAAKEVDVWIGRDLGWRGGRRTGIALVDEFALDNYARSIELPDLRKATTGPAMRERTATEIHLARQRIAKRLFFWNVFPFHPHEEGKPLSNRMHTRSEKTIGLELLTEVLLLLPVRHIVTIGNDAAIALQEAGIHSWPVRHPSYGGQTLFHQQIDAHYQIHKSDQNQRALFD